LEESLSQFIRGYKRLFGEPAALRHPATETGRTPTLAD
jgi:hypothetical protein